MAFKEVDPNVSFPALEQEIERWWKQHDIVKQALAAGDREQPFIFFEGPPTANGRPGVHHVEARSVKDIIIRYQRMRGKYVVGARGGWDTHGLPVEIEVEKELGFSGKPDIEKYGIAEFNQACKASVQRYIAEWERMTDRIAFWIDMENPYSTYDNSYIESLWWIFRRLWDDGLLFRDYKVTMHCPRCGTSLSDHEVSQGFRDDVDDPSVWVRFRVRAAGSAHPELDGAAFLAWTTTPWTLPANVALAVNPSAQYVLAEYTGGDAPERLVLAEALAERVLGAGSYRVLASYEGESLWGVHYERLFDGVPGPGASVDTDQAYHVVADDFVSLEDGTGIVHIAPAYGDLEIGRKYNLPTLFSVDLAGNTYESYAALGFGGMFFKQADPLIMRNLSERGLLFRSGRVKHAYPFCWRCGTALLYYAKPSWYIRTTARKDRLLHNNQLIDWVPEHIKGGRFGNWLENNIDWAVSRERYWGTPLPIWISADGQHTECIGSLAELEQRAGRSLQDLDLHRPYVDAITWEHPQHGTMRRIADVADCWFDSGAMQVAQWHYPFENQELFERAGQADYISEAIDQTRGWFYTLHALGTLLFDRPAFKHVICLGHILDIKGEKMSKSKGNVVDPWELLQNYGADATRWYMYASAPPYNPRSFAPTHVGEVLRQFVLTLWNTYSFFVTYANLDGWKPGEPEVGSRESGVGASADTSTPQPPNPNPIDQWALARLHALIRDVTAAFDRYDIHTPAKLIEGFVDDLSNWYVRRNRRRFWKAESDADKQAAYATLYTCLTTLSRLLAPFMPFLSESLYQNLVVGQAAGVPASVHLAAWPQADARLIDVALLDDTALLLQAISLGRAARRAAKLKVRQPLGTLWLRVPASGLAGIQRFEAELRDELNVKQVRYLDAATDLVTYRFKPNLKLVGKQYGKLVPALTAALRELVGPAAQAAAHTLEAGQPLALDVAGQPITRAPEAVLVESSSPAGYAVAESNGVLIALDTSITPELRAEGQARELVRQIQDARKAAGLAIADRVALSLAGGDDELAALLAGWGANIQAETLAESLVLGAPAAGAHTAPLELDGRALTLGLRRVA